MISGPSSKSKIPVKNARPGNGRALEIFSKHSVSDKHATEEQSGSVLQRY